MLDEQEQDEINLKLQLAIYNNLTIMIKHYVNHDYKMSKGKLRSIDVMSGLVLLDRTRIKLEDVLDVIIE